MLKPILALSVAGALGLAGCAAAPTTGGGAAPTTLTLAQFEADAQAAAEVACAFNPALADIGTAVTKGGLAANVATVSTVVSILCAAYQAQIAATASVPVSGRYRGVAPVTAVTVTLPNGAVVTIHAAPLASHRYRH
jgi:hypothetical protein